MRKLIAKKPCKAILFLLQAVAVGSIAFFIIGISFWMEDSYSLTELSRSYEESDLFFQQVDAVIANKIRGQDNAYYLETDGEFDREKLIDIQSYNVTGSVVQDMNTTYRLGDLLDFYENGGWQRLHDAIEEAPESKGLMETGEWLDEHSSTLETVMPVTGITQAECSRWYSDPSSYVQEIYTKLDEACEDLYERYIEYTTVQNESWSDKAPSNLLYCIENTATGVLYTNTDASDYESAVSAAESEDDYTSLYEGERSFNIVVTNPESVLNSEASEWFMQERIVGTNERIYLAVDLSYPVSDDLKVWAEYYAQRESIVTGIAILTLIAFAVLLVCFILSVAGAGFREEDQIAHLLRFDEIPSEVALGLYLIVGILYYLIISEWDRITEILPVAENALTVLMAASAWLIFLSACLSLVRRIRCGTLWTNSIIRITTRTWNQVTSSRAASWRIFFLYVGYFAVNILILLLFGRAGLVIVVLLGIAVLMYLMRGMAGTQSIYEGIHQLSRGDLNYRIDTSSLSGESLEMAKAVNEMGDSLRDALEAIVKDERMKAELITNVSHDLKTPLTSIVNYIDLIKRENLQDERLRYYVDVLDQKSQRLKQLTEDLVEVSKISSGNIELEIVRMELQSMLMQACGEYEERLEEHGLHLIWEMDKEPIYIMADGRQLWRILENLLGNIYKYAKKNTDVRVELWREGEEAVIGLRNISEEKIEVETDELTSRFVRGDSSRNTEGSGLGLSIAQNLTELLEGKFELQVEDNVFTAYLRFRMSE